MKRLSGITSLAAAGTHSAACRPAASRRGQNWQLAAHHSHATPSAPPCAGTPARGRAAAWRQAASRPAPEGAHPPPPSLRHRRQTSGLRDSMWGAEVHSHARKPGRGRRQGGKLAGAGVSGSKEGRCWAHNLLGLRCAAPQAAQVNRGASSTRTRHNLAAGGAGAGGELVVLSKRLGRLRARGRQRAAHRVRNHRSHRPQGGGRVSA